MMKNFKQKQSSPEGKDLKLKTPKVSEYMTRKLITFTTDTPINEAIDTLLKNRITGAPVLDRNGDVAGLIDDKDCLKVIFSSGYYNHPVGNETVKDYMSNVMRTITIDSDLMDAANIFVTSPFKRLLVKDENGKLAGMISRRDVLRAIKELNLNTW
jgi:predicted transcriptional regulator